MGLPPLSGLLCLTVLCHLVALLAGEWGGLRHERGKGSPEPHFSPSSLTSGPPEPSPGKAEIPGSPFLTYMPGGGGRSWVWGRRVGGMRLDTSLVVWSALQLEKFTLTRDCPCLAQ